MSWYHWYDLVLKGAGEDYLAIIDDLRNTYDFIYDAITERGFTKNMSKFDIRYALEEFSPKYPNVTFEIKVDWEDGARWKQVYKNGIQIEEILIEGGW